MRRWWRNFVLTLAALVVAGVWLFSSGAPPAAGAVTVTSTHKMERPVGKELRRVEQGFPSLTFSQPVDLIRSEQASQNPLATLSLVEADLTDDGIPDLIEGAASASGGVLRLFEARYDEASDLMRYSEACQVSVNLAPELLSAGDFNGDGHQDLIVASGEENQFLFLAGDGQGSGDGPSDGGGCVVVQGASQ